MGFRTGWRLQARLARWLVGAGVVLAAGGLAGPAQAGVSYSQQTVPFTGLASAVGVAVDSSGDVFVTDDAATDDGGAQNSVDELAADGQQSQLYATQAFLNRAVASGNDLYVAMDDTDGTGSVLQIPLSGAGSAVSIPVSGSLQPTGVAVDSAGDLFVCDQDTGDVYELQPQPGGGWAQSTVLTGLVLPQGIAVDAAGDLFVTGGAGVQELPAGDSSSGLETIYDPPGADPTAVAVDPAGNVYVTVQGSALELIELVPQPDGSFATTVLEDYSDLQDPFGAVGVAVDEHGDVFTAGTTFDGQTAEVLELAVQQSQSISWAQQGPYLQGTSPVALDASASSNLPVSYTVGSGPCSVSGSTLTLTGAGVCVVTASQAGNDQYVKAAAVTQSIVVEYGFEGFVTPAPWGSFEPGSAIPVWFVLTNAAGKPIPAATAAALAKAGQVQAVLTGSGIAAQTAACSWYSVVFECTVKAPKTVKTGTANPYVITAQENVGGGFLTAPALRPAQNPVTIYFK